MKKALLLLLFVPLLTGCKLEDWLNEKFGDKEPEVVEPIEEETEEETEQEE